MHSLYLHFRNSGKNIAKSKIIGQRFFEGIDGKQVAVTPVSNFHIIRLILRPIPLVNSKESVQGSLHDVAARVITNALLGFVDIITPHAAV